MRPVPTVFLRLAFSLQLTVLRWLVSGSMSSGSIVEVSEHTLADLGRGVAAGGALLLLGAERTAAWIMS